MTTNLPNSDEHAALTDADRVRQAVFEICRLQAEIDQDRTALVERGVPAQALRTLVDLGAKDDEKAQRPLYESALQSSAAACVDPLDRAELEARVREQAKLQKEILSIRHDATIHGLEAQALNQLTQLIYRNPDDRGERVIAALFSYAIACGTEIEPVAKALAELEREPESVLPKIDRAGLREAASRRGGLVADAAVGLGIGLVVMWLFV